jgi:hypothetical protein
MFSALPLCHCGIFDSILSDLGHVDRRPGWVGNCDSMHLVAERGFDHVCTCVVQGGTVQRNPIMVRCNDMAVALRARGGRNMLLQM